MKKKITRLLSLSLLIILCLVMVFSIGVGKQVVSDPDLLKGLQEPQVKPLKQRAGRDPLCIGPDADGRAVGVRS